MQAFKSILVAYDFSEGSMLALRQACFLADEFGAALHIVVVIDDSITEIFAADAINALKQRVVVDVAQILKQAKTDDVLTVHVEVGRSEKRIISLVLSHGFDLLVVGSHSRSKLGYAFLGSVADRVARLSPVPVLICRGDMSKDVNKVLIPLESDRDADRVLNVVKPLAEAFELRLVLLHAIESKSALTSDSQIDSSGDKTSALSGFKSIQTMYQIADEPVIVHDSPSHAILSQVKSDKSIGLVALMTHGQNGIKEALLGSTALSVVRFVECNALVLPTEDHAKRIVEMKDYFNDKKVSFGNILI